ncbi:MAG: HRDC domain-containing protein, partial [Candidatus Omnitrophica bacterium]|nr:HRDC domain-containing protein [Candidatus Omnitrophota bacterium]
KAQDKPPFRILHSEFLIRAAKWAQHHPHHLLQVDVAQMPQIPAEVKGRYRVGVNGAIQEALALPPAEIVKKPRHFRNSKEAIAIQERLSALKAEREKAAKELEVESGFLVPNAVLETLAEKRPKNRQEMETLGCFLPWQLDVLADSFLKALRH